MKIIGISGKKQSGKDTTAALMYDILRATKPKLNVFIYKFATGLKQAAAAILNCNVEDFEKEEQKNSPAAPWLPNLTKREFLQKLGTNVAHEISPSLWVDRLFYILDKYPKDADILVIITDVRFPLEAGKILLKGGDLLRVHNAQQYKLPEDNAPSETALDNYSFPFVLVNQKNSLNELQEEVINYLKAINLLTEDDLLNCPLLSPGDRAV